jgi:hypothetical protein
MIISERLNTAYIMLHYPVIKLNLLSFIPGTSSLIYINYSVFYDILSQKYNVSIHFPTMCECEFYNKLQ